MAYCVENGIHAGKQRVQINGLIVDDCVGAKSSDKVIF